MKNPFNCANSCKLKPELDALKEILRTRQLEEIAFTRTTAKELNHEMKIENDNLKTSIEYLNKERQKLNNDIKYLESVIETLCSRGIDYV